MKALLLISLLFLTGCAHISVVTPDGIKAEYTRWFNQQIEGFYVESPDGWKAGFAKQQSEFELGYQFGLLKGKIGGGE